MTLYAASNVMFVGLGSEHGGCGQSHSRPVEQGVPVHPWALTCPGCEDHLRHDPLWSATISKIPETLDERLAREDFETRGAIDERRVMMIALAKLAGVELPDTIALALTGNKPHIPSGTMVCPSGHENLPGMKFCGECGSPMHGAAPNREIASPAAPQAAQERAASPAQGSGSANGDRGSVDLLALHPKTLAAMCRKEGLDDTGSREDMATRITEHRKKVAA